MSPLSNLAVRDVETLVHPYINLASFRESGPLVIERAQGVYVYDSNGKAYIEGMAGLWCASLGFSENKIAEAIAKQCDELPFYHLFNGKAHVAAIELADRLKQIAPAAMAKVFFGSSGSDANDTAVKIVWYYNNVLGRPRKKKIIARHQAYHGTSISAASLSGLANNHRLFDLPIPNILHTECPHHYRFAEPGENEEQFATRLAEKLEDLIVAEGPDTIAAFIAEPVMGAGGVIIPPQTYFARIQKVLEKYDILLIADEVICGFARTGSMWGSETFGMRPDIVTCAKAITGGYLPLSATMITEPIYRALMGGSNSVGAFAHGYTYSGHPLATAAGLATLAIYEEIDVVSVARRASKRFLERLHGFADHPLIGETRGVGLVGAIELTSDRAKRQPFPPQRGFGNAVVQAAQAHGVILRAMVNDTISFCPPLTISDDEIDIMFDRFGAALEHVAAHQHAAE